MSIKRIFFSAAAETNPKLKKEQYIYYNEFNITFLKKLFVSLIVKGF